MTFKIVIEAWESYNSGYLLGQTWHDISDFSMEDFEELLEKTQKEYKQELNKLLKWQNSQCEELFAPDYECDLPITYVESGLISMFKEYLELKDIFENESEDIIELTKQIKENEGLDDWAEALEKAESAYDLGTQYSEKSAQEELSHLLMESTGELDQIPENLRNYFDHESFGRDLVLGGDYYLINIDSNYYAVSNY
jgi:antirestriction protein